MFVLISYDIQTKDETGQARLRRIAAICEDYGQRVQYSIFECVLDPADWEVCRQRLLDTADNDVDSLRFYFLGNHWRRKIEHHGAKTTIDPEGPLLI